MSNHQRNTSGLIPFQPGQSGNLQGRPRKIYTILKDSGYSRDDITAAFAHIGWQTLDDLEEILNDDTKPAILKVIARAFIKGAEKGDFRYVQEILAYTVGRPLQKVETQEDMHITLVIDPSPPKPRSEKDIEFWVDYDSTKETPTEYGKRKMGLLQSNIDEAELVERLPKVKMKEPDPEPEENQVHLLTKVNDPQPQPKKSKWIYGINVGGDAYDSSDPESF